MVIGALGIADAARPGILRRRGAVCCRPSPTRRRWRWRTRGCSRSSASRRRQIAVLADIEREFAAELDSARLLRLVVERSGRLFAADGGIYLLDDDGMLVRRGVDQRGPGRHPRDAGRDAAGRAPAAERRGVLANDYPRSPLARPDFIAHGIRHAMAQPLVIGDRVRGVVTMSRSGDDAEPFSADDLAAAGELRGPGRHRAGERAPVPRGGDAGRAPAHAEPAQSPGDLVARSRPGPVLHRRGRRRDRAARRSWPSGWPTRDTRTLRMQSLRDTSSRHR